MLIPCSYRSEVAWNAFTALMSSVNHFAKTMAQLRIKHQTLSE